MFTYYKSDESTWDWPKGMPRSFQSDDLYYTNANSVGFEVDNDTTFNADDCKDLMRTRRATLLPDVDVEAVKCQYTGTSISSAWATYRVDLLDITDGLTTVSDFKAVVWPTKP